MSSLGVILTLGTRLECGSNLDLLGLWLRVGLRLVVMFTDAINYYRLAFISKQQLNTNKNSKGE